MSATAVDDNRWRVLLEGLRVGPVELPNRLVFGPHCPVFVDTQGRPTEQFAAYFAERARGGAGLVIIGVSAIDLGGTQFPIVVPALFDDRAIDGLRQTAEAVHEHGTRLFIQLTHPGLQGDPRGLRDPVIGVIDRRWTAVAPSALPSPGYPGVVARELSEPEIEALIEGFVAAAKRAARAGLDGVEIQAAVGFLVEQFLSPLYNQRTDRWGGSLENRARFLLEILARTRAAVGDRLAIGVRLTMDEQLPGGYDLQEAKRIVGLLEAQGVYDYLNTCLGQVQMPHVHIATLYTQEAFERDLVAEIRGAATRPVFMSNRITSPVMAGALIADGVADAVSMVRQLIADPDTLRKAAAGQLDEVRPCLSCNQWCIGNVFQGMKVSCVVNPRAGRESRLPGVARATEARRILIIGGGPAGLKAAEQAAECGHAVVLHEATETLGGAVRLAAALPGRRQIGAAVEHLVGRIARLGVEVHLGSRLDPAATLALIAAERFDEVIVATGATRATLGWSGATLGPVPGAAGNPLVLGVDEVIGGRRPAGSRVLVYDEPGDIVAAGVAELLASEGYTVELVTRWPQIGPQLALWGVAYDVLSRLHAAGVRLITGHLVAAVTSDGVRLVDPVARRETERAVDGIPLVGAPRRDSALYEALQAEAQRGPWRLHRIGDALAPRSIGEAIFEGDQVARQISGAAATAERPLALASSR